MENKEVHAVTEVTLRYPMNARVTLYSKWVAYGGYLANYLLGRAAINNQLGVDFTQQYQNSQACPACPSFLTCQLQECILVGCETHHKYYLATAFKWSSFRFPGNTAYVAGHQPVTWVPFDHKATNCPAVGYRINCCPECVQDRFLSTIKDCHTYYNMEHRDQDAVEGASIYVGLEDDLAVLSRAGLNLLDPQSRRTTITGVHRLTEKVSASLPIWYCVDAGYDVSVQLAKPIEHMNVSFTLEKT